MDASANPVTGEGLTVDVVGRAYRPEIQGLRAIAVALVFLFHLWPSGVSGGYVGVDVFFVISGYLITLGLVREIETRGSVSLLAFYVRRARRILPAATLVLLVIALLVPLLPVTRWEDTARGIAASALYVENWLLVRQAVDYFAATGMPTPVQHYWSLSVEEQFYLGWPVLLLVGAVLFRTARSRRAGLVVLMGSVLAASFAASVLVTGSDPARAYYVTHTRVWELALGGMLALLGPVALRGTMAALAGTLGVVAILAAGFAFSSATPFPGAAALLPTLGTVLVILSGAASPRSPVAVLGWRPLQYLGDRSYSLYLWHWPVIVFVTARGDAIDPATGLWVIVAVLALSHLSYRFVEQPFRARGRVEAWLRPLALAFAAIAACVVASGAIHFLLVDRGTPEPIALGDPDYPGPAALLSGLTVPTGVPVRPSVARLARPGTGRPPTVALGCRQEWAGAEPLSCTFGDAASAVDVVLVGDSIAEHWTTALIQIVEARGWRLRTYIKASCPFAATTVLLQGRPYDSCADWRDRVLAELHGDPPDVVVTAQSRYILAPRVGEPGTMTGGLIAIWTRLQQLGTRIVPIAATPQFVLSPVECLAQDRASCGRPRAEALPESDAVREAAAAIDISLVDMIDGLCGPSVCEPVVGNVLVWRDQVHLTTGYARLLAPLLAERAGF